MKIISGRNTDLITPFPEVESPRIFGWKHCYRTLPEDDDAPQGQEEFIQAMQETLPYTLSAGVIDKNQLTTTRHEAPLVGICLFIPSGKRDGILHFAIGRKAFRAGLMMEAVALFLTEVFAEFPDLLRVSVLLDDNNSPAKSLLKKQGFKYEGTARDAVMVGGSPRARVAFGVTREDLITLCMTTPEDAYIVATHEQAAPVQELVNAVGCE